METAKKPMLLSIIIPVYNVEDYLPECIACLKQQNFPGDVEILMIDDGSTDGSGELCDRAAASDSHIRVFHQKNKGVAEARNRGIAESRGRYIAWVDPDDYITKDWWQAVSEELAKDPEMLYFDMVIKKPNREYAQYYGDADRDIGKKELCRDLATNKITPALWSKVILREYYLRVLENYGYVFDPKISLCEDYSAMHHICWPVATCRYMHRAIYVYRMRQGSICHVEGMSLSRTYRGIDICQSRMDFYQCNHVDVGEAADFGLAMSEHYFIIAYHTYASDQEKLEYRDAYERHRRHFRHYGWRLIGQDYVCLREKIDIMSIMLGLDKYYGPLKLVIKKLLKNRIAYK